jgi:hypothetical protein
MNDESPVCVVARKRCSTRASSWVIASTPMQRTSSDRKVGQEAVGAEP